MKTIFQPPKVWYLIVGLLCAVVLVFFIAVRLEIANQNRVREEAAIAANLSRDGAHLASLRDETAEAQRDTDAIGSAESALASIISSGEDASQARGRDYNSDAVDTDTELQDANGELSDVESMPEAISQLETAYEQADQTFVTIYGEGSVSSFREDYQKAISSARGSEDDWWRAIRGVRDMLHAESEGRYGYGDSGEAESLYQQSDHDESDFETAENAADLDLKELRLRLQAEITSTQAQIRALGGSVNVPTPAAPI